MTTVRIYIQIIENHPTSSANLPFSVTTKKSNLEETLANFKSDSSLFLEQTDFIFLPFFFFLIFNVKQTFISGAKPQDMLVKTVAGLC